MNAEDSRRYAGLVIRAEAAEAHAERLDRVLQSLTPGGSEFVHDPDRCVAFVQDARAGEMRALKAAVKRAQEAEAHAEALQQELSLIDSLLARREAIDKCPTRYDKITKALATASRAEELEAAEKSVSDAYLRIRSLVGSWNTLLGGTDRFELTEKKIKDLKAKAEQAEDEVQRLREVFRGHDKAALEAMADMEHERWARWFEYQRDNSAPERIEHWTLIADKPYAFLTEELKEKDRREVLRILGAGLAVLTPPEAQGREENTSLLLLARSRLWHILDTVAHAMTHAEARMTQDVIDQIDAVITERRTTGEQPQGEAGGREEA